MKHTHQFLLTATALLFSMSMAMAATSQPGPRQVTQSARISQGVASGELNHREAHQLRAQQKGVQCHKRAVKADGIVTPREKRQLDRHQDRASKNIYRKKHNLR